VIIKSLKRIETQTVKPRANPIKIFELDLSSFSVRLNVSGAVFTTFIFFGPIS
jgi:hypothetical protein